MSYHKMLKSSLHSLIASDSVLFLPNDNLWHDSNTGLPLMAVPPLEVVKQYIKNQSDGIALKED